MDIRTDITLAFTEYQRYIPLASGNIQSNDINLNWIRGPRSELLRRTISDPTVDGGEGSMLRHLLRIDQGDPSFLAIPIFLLRKFTARSIYVPKGSLLKNNELNGKRIGIYSWAASGAVWYRHLIRYLGQDPYEIQWIIGGTDSPRSVNNGVALPSHVTYAPEDKSLSDLLIEGKIDACFVPSTPKQYHPTDGPIVRLFPDYRLVEQKYYIDTGCYPAQHVLLLREKKWLKDKSIGNRLIDLFNQCEEYFAASQRQYPYNTPWQIEDVERTELLMGQDFHIHGLEKSYRAIDEFCKCAYEDKLTNKRLTVEDYFSEFLNP
jgi:4,5-dihydroxyphthalate decarboxylase